MQDTRNSILTDDLDAICAWERANGVESDRRQLSRGRGVFQTDIAVVGELIVWRWRESQRLLSDMHYRRTLSKSASLGIPNHPFGVGCRLIAQRLRFTLGGESYCSIVPPGGVAYGLVLRRSSPKLRDLVTEEVLTHAMRRKGRPQRQFQTGCSTKCFHCLIRCLSPTRIRFPRQSPLKPAVAE